MKAFEQLKNSVLKGIVEISLQEYYNTMKSNELEFVDHYDNFLFESMQKRRENPEFKVTQEELQQTLIETIKQVPLFETKIRKLWIEK